jgi:hypothetical protein
MMADVTAYADPSEYSFEGFDEHEYESHPGHNCPRCDSPAPHLHPGGVNREPETCIDDYHLIRTNQNRQLFIDAVLAKRGVLHG